MRSAMPLATNGTQVINFVASLVEEVLEGGTKQKIVIADLLL